MRRSVAIGAVAVLVSAVTGAATSTAAVAAPPAGEIELFYAGDLLDAGHVADSSGKNLHGLISTGGTGSVTSVVAPQEGAFLRFPAGSCTVAPPCPQAIVSPPATISLVPSDEGTSRFVYAADIRLTEPPSGAAGMNVFQFGAAAAGVSQWKLQVDHGRPSCRWSDGATVVLLPAGDEGFRFAVGRWYRVSCWRLSPVLFQLRVDDPSTGHQVLPPKNAVGPLNGILPSGPVVIGGKRIRATQTDVDTDQFHGDLDDVEFGRRVPPNA
jgi:hypothetical protein